MNRQHVIAVVAALAFCGGTSQALAQSGTYRAGSTTDADSVTAHATAPYAMATLPTRRRLISARKAIACPNRSHPWA